MNLLIQQKPQIFDLNEETAPGTRLTGSWTGRRTWRDRRQPSRGGAVLGAGPRRRPARDHSGQGQQRLLGGVRRAALERLHAARNRSVPQDLRPVFVSRRAVRRRPAYRQRLRLAVSPGRDAVQLQGAPEGQRVLHARLDPDRRAGRGLLRRNRLHGRTLALSHPPGGRPGPQSVRGLANRQGRDTGRYGPTWTKADGSFCTGPGSGCANAETSTSCSRTSAGITP